MQPELQPEGLPFPQPVAWVIVSGCQSFDLQGTGRCASGMPATDGSVTDPATSFWADRDPLF
jgi:hypothetical protein